MLSKIEYDRPLLRLLLSEPEDELLLFTPGIFCGAVPEPDDWRRWPLEFDLFSSWRSSALAKGLVEKLLVVLLVCSGGRLESCLPELRCRSFSASCWVLGLGVVVK